MHELTEGESTVIARNPVVRMSDVPAAGERGYALVPKEGVLKCAAAQDYRADADDASHAADPVDQRPVETRGDCPHGLSALQIRANRVEQRLPVAVQAVAERISALRPGIGGRFERHGRLSLEAIAIGDPGDGRHRVEQPSHAR